MIQTGSVVEQLRQQWPTLEISIEQIHTRGDHIQDRPLSQLGGDGVFVMEIERALREGRIDLAVHSLKDLPTAQPEGLYLTAVGSREDVRDVMVFQSPSMLPLPEHGSQQEKASSLSPLPLAAGNGLVGYTARPLHPLRIGTCSLRRTAQALALYPDAHILPLRGNVDTRLRKLDAGDYDCIVLAAAGLHRMNLRERLADRLLYLPVDAMMPAPGQGALALEVRDESAMRALIAPLINGEEQATTSAERMFMRRLGAGCYLPVAAYGEVAGDILTLRGLVISQDGRQQVRVQQSMTWTPETPVERAERLGALLAEQALAQGADEIIRSLIDREMLEQEKEHV
ncbi:MAG TPA: hydroxymethylbilane synthase [Ktedonobacteraceae bacterium]|nr:hydroxymethylbilane synthase [Ktedonobacteraceae bacterium]